MHRSHTTADPLRDTRVLLTGAGGLVGRAVAAGLAAHGASVRAFVRETLAPGATEVVRGDIRDARAVSQALDDVTVVVHLAARFVGTDDEIRAVNVEATRGLAECAAAGAVSRFVLVSSASVYGAGPFARADESTPLRPDYAYAISKAEAEVAAREALPAAVLTVLRPVTAYRTGPCPFIDQLRWAVESAPLPRVPDRNPPIDLLHVEDLAAAVLSGAAGAGAGGTFNLAGPAPAPYCELGESAGRSLGVVPRWVDVTSPGTADASRFPPGLLAAAAVEKTVSIDRARVHLGYRPTRRWEAEVPAALAPAR